MAGLAAGLSVVGASYGVSALAVHGQTAEAEHHVQAAAHAAGSTAASTQLVAAGAALYTTASCVGCHGAQAQGGGIGPTLHHLGDPDAKVALHIANGFAGRMPAYKDQLTPNQINTLVAYIQTYE